MSIGLPELGRRLGTRAFRSLDEYPDGETYPGLLILRFDAGLFFASAEALKDRPAEFYEQADPKTHTAVIDFEGIHFIDSQGADVMAQILDGADY